MLNNAKKHPFTRYSYHTESSLKLLKLYAQVETDQNRVYLFSQALIKYLGNSANPIKVMIERELPELLSVIPFVTPNYGTMNEILQHIDTLFDDPDFYRCSEYRNTIQL